MLPQSEKTLSEAGIAPRGRAERGSRYSEYVFGIYPVNLALKMKKRSFYRLFLKDSVFGSDTDEVGPSLREILETADLLHLPTEPRSKKELDRITNQRPHQGVVLESSGLATPYIHEPGDIKKGLYLFLDEIKDVMNFGSILRSCAFFGVRGVFLPCDSSVSPSPIISKLSSGALEIVDLYRVSDKARFVKQMCDAGVTVIGTSGEDFVSGSRTVNIDEVESTLLRRLRGGPTMLVLGREDKGLTSEVASLCHHLLRIPHITTLHNHMTSLNVATATSVLLYFLTNNNLDLLQESPVN